MLENETLFVVILFEALTGLANAGVTALFLSKTPELTISCICFISR